MPYIIGIKVKQVIKTVEKKVYNINTAGWFVKKQVVSRCNAASANRITNLTTYIHNKIWWVL